MRRLLRLSTDGDGAFRLNLKYFRHHTHDLTSAWNGSAPNLGPIYKSELENLLGPARPPASPLEQRHQDLARSAQAVELDLSAHTGRSPVELFGRSRFPQIGELRYLLTLAPRGFYRFQLVQEGEEAIG